MRYLALICCLSWSVSLLAQLPSDNLADYQKALNGIVLLGNAEKELPLGGLDTLRPAMLGVGFDEDSEFYHTLNTYVPTGYIRWQTEEDIVWPNGTPPAKSNTCNLLILAIDAESMVTSSINWSRFLFDPNTPVVLCIFGRSATTDNIGIGPLFLFSEQRSAWAQSLMAQALFGAISIDNKLGEGLNERHPSGSGLQLEACQRLAFAPPAAQKMATSILQDSIRHIVESGRLHRAFPSAQVLVAKAGTVVYHETFGYHSSEILTPTRKTDLYDLASVTKISSALAAVMRFHGQGRFDLEAPLSQYYPLAKGSNKAALDFRNMFAHQARLRPWIPYWQATLRGNGKYPWSKNRDPERINDYRFKARTFKRDSSKRYPIYVADDLWLHHRYQRKMMKAILKSPLREKTAYVYSGLLFYQLPSIIEKLSGENYETHLRNTFYGPLGAHSITYNPTRYFSTEEIIPTERDSFFRMTPIHGHVHDEGAAMMGGVSANAGLFANAYDIAKLMQMYLNGGTYGGERYIAAESLAEFTRCQFCPDGNRRGLGFDKPLIEYDVAKSSVAEAASPSSFGHSGYTGTFVWADPEQDLLFIFLSNRVYPSRTNRGIYLQNIRPRIHAAIYQAMSAKEDF